MTTAAHTAPTAPQMGRFLPNQDCSGSGYPGANRAAEDLGIQKWWEPTKQMNGYVEVYLQQQ